jgi:HK97 family phage portal protein
VRNIFKRRESWDGLADAGSKALTASPEVLDGLRDRGWSPYPRLGGGARQRVLDAYNTAQSATYAWIYTNSPAVRTVVDVLVRNIGQLDLRLYEEISESEREPRPEHPAALSLRYPNETTTGDKLRRSLIKDFLIFDNAYALMLPAPAGRLNVTWVPAHMVEIRGSSLFRAEGYRVWRRDGTWVDFQPESVLHWHGENPHDPRMGLSKLDTLRGVIAEDAALQQAIVELAQSGMAEPTWVYRPGDAPQWSNEARHGFEEDLTARVRRRNRIPVVMEEGMELRSFGVSPKDAQMMEVRRWAIEQVASEYGVPLGMVGLADDVEEARALFYTDTLPPYCEDFTRMLDQRVLVRVYDWTSGCFEFNLDEKHMGDDRLKALVSATGRPVMLTNEARALVNLPAVDGGDELVTPLNVMVGEKPSVDVMPIQDPNGPEQDGSYRESNHRTLQKAADVTPEALPQLHPGRKAELERQHRAIDECQAVVQRHFTRMGRSLKAKAATDWSRWDREFSDDLHAVLERLVDSEGSLYALKLAAGTDFDMRRVRNYLRAMAEGAASGINDKVREEIAELGVPDAMGKAAMHVENAGASLGAGAIRFAREEAARQAPGADARVKSWVPNTARHAQYAGQAVPLGADWPAGFAPGSAPGCKCTLSIT